jgi:ubiquitin-protein ligase
MMIDFNCTNCGWRISVADSAAGKNLRCRSCHHANVIPQPSAPPKTSTPMRTRRLRADAEEMNSTFAAQIQSAVGDPPELYIIELCIKGLEKPGQVRDRHTIELQLTSEYPRVAPKCRMLTPIFHPNIDAATICVGDHWTAGERLVDLVVRIGEMIAYQQYNIKSPLNAEAAMWADLHAGELPIDPSPIRPPDLGQAA